MPLNGPLVLRRARPPTPAPKLFCFGCLLLRGSVLLRNSQKLREAKLLEVESTKLLIRYKSFFDLFCVLEFRIKMDFGGVCYFP